MIKKPISEYTAEELEYADASVEEQETTLQKSRGEEHWYLWTNDNLMITKIKRLMAQNPEGFKLKEIMWTKDSTPFGYGFEIDTKLISFRTKRVEKVMTEEQRQAAAERMKAMVTARRRKGQESDAEEEAEE